MLSVCRNLHDFVTDQKAMDSVYPVSFGEFLAFTLENKVTRLSQAFSVLQRLLNVTLRFSSDSDDQRRLWKRKDEGWL